MLPVRVVFGTSIKIALVTCLVTVHHGLHSALYLEAQPTNSPPATYLEVVHLSDDVTENRMTRGLTQQRLSRHLLARTAGHVVWAYTSHSGEEKVYEFVVDPAWNRIIYLRRNDNWFRAYGTGGSGAGEFTFPKGVDIDDDLNLYVADQGNRRIAVVRFALQTEHIEWVFAVEDNSWSPMDVAWDNNGTVSDLTDDYLWILHDDRDEDILEGAGRVWSDTLEWEAWPRMQVLDLSRMDGGSFSPHTSHQNGRDVDIRYLRTFGVEVAPEYLPGTGVLRYRGNGRIDRLDYRLWRWSAW